MSILYDVLRNRHNETLKSLKQKDNQLATPAEPFEPRVLWIGCTDSKLSSSLISGLESGQVLMHCNPANQVCSNDLNLQAVLEYALQQLSVSHIIVCGHYGCKGILAALENEGDNMPKMNDWLSGIYRLAAQYGDELRALTTQQARANRLAELNVFQQVKLLKRHPLVAKHRITLLPWIHDTKNGKIKDLSRGKVYSKILMS